MSDAVAKAWDAAADRARDLRAEQSVLGACLTKPAILGWLDLDPEAFFDARHRWIFGAMRELDQERHPVDEVTVAARLQAQGWLASSGGALYLAELTLRCPTVDNVVAYASVLRSHLTTRRLIALASSLPSRIADGTEGEELLDAVQLALSQLEPVERDPGAPMSELVRREVQTLVEWADRERKAGETAGVPTGIKVLDDKIGGLRVGVPTMIGARPGDGKSSTAISIGRAAARAGYPTHLITYEDAPSVFAQRSISADAGVPVMSISARTFTPQDVSSMLYAVDLSRDLDKLFVDRGHGMNVDRACRMVRARKRQHGTKLLLIDYAQLVPPRDHERKWDRQQSLRAQLEAWAELCAVEQLALGIFSQLRRPTTPDAPPTMEHFLGSGAFEEIGKLVLLLWPKRDTSDMRIIVAKNSQGPTAQLTAGFDKAHCYVG